jgi:Flp pilus assembly protein TadG
MRARRDSGQLLPLFAVILLVACGSILLLGRLGQLAHRRAQARTAADAAALAGAAGGRSAAEDVATANGAVLVAFDVHGGDVDVRVRVGSTHAIARARREPGCQSLPQVHPVHFAACQPSSPG